MRPVPEKTRRAPCSALSKGQTSESVEDGACVEVTATVEDDELLRWWLLAFGPKV